MPVSNLHRQVAAVALAAAREHGFALGGGNALLAYGVISRPTQDVDLFTDQQHGVEAAAWAVETALRHAGFETERQDQVAGLDDLFPGMGEGLAEWVVTAPSGAQMMLQLAAALERYTPAQLIGFARRLDPGLTGQDFAEAGLRLDQMDDRAFAEIGLSAPDVTRLRERLAAWPRSAEAADRESRFEDPSERQAAAGQTPTAGRSELGMHEPDSAAGRQQPGPEPAAQPGRDDPETEP